MIVNLKRYGSMAALSVVVALGVGTSTTLASTHPRAVAQLPYGCTIHPNASNCKTGTGGTRVTGGATGTKGKTGGTRSSGGTTGKRAGASGTNGKRGSGANALGAGANGKGANGKGANGKGAGANGSSPVPSRGVPITGFGGTAQDFGVSPRASAAGTQPVVVGLASSPGSQHVSSLPATGGGSPTQPQLPVVPILACGLVMLGLGLRKVAVRF
ncbi:MAG TPA: hypothetical protein VIO57_17565 [Chloroflexota bacterium]